MCSICGAEYKTEEAATECEALGDPPIEFTNGQKVTLQQHHRTFSVTIVDSRVRRQTIKDVTRHVRRYAVRRYGDLRWYSGASFLAA